MAADGTVAMKIVQCLGVGAQADASRGAPRPLQAPKPDP